MSYSLLCFEVVDDGYLL